MKISPELPLVIDSHEIEQLDLQASHIESALRLDVSTPEALKTIHSYRDSLEPARHAEGLAEPLRYSRSCGTHLQALIERSLEINALYRWSGKLVV